MAVGRQDESARRDDQTMSRVTSQDVARDAGVSQSAVSRVFTPGASVSKKVAARVRRSAARLGYRPNAVARSLITGETKIIGLAVAELDNLFYPRILELLSEHLQRVGYHIMMFFADVDDAANEKLFSNLLDYQVDGLIAASATMSGAPIERCREGNIPIVLFNRHQGKDGPTSVTSDNFAGGRLAATLLAKEHERIAHISGWQGSSTGRERQEGFLAGLRAADRDLVACIDGRYCQQAAREATLNLYTDGGCHPDALFVGSDQMAFAVMDTLRGELNLRIPQDVSVIGFDDVPMAAWPPYRLTTIRQPLEQLVAATVEQLRARIKDPNLDFDHMRLPCEIQIRESARIDRELYSEEQ